MLRLALRDISRSAFRSWVIALCACLVAALGLATLVVTRGAQESLGLVSSRLGADIIVVPAGSQSTVENALLMGVPTGKWLPAADLQAVRALPGVAAASPQVYLASLAGASCCSVSSMFLVAFDPASDFTVQPWIDRQLGSGGLAMGDGLGGSLVSVPDGDAGLTLYGYPLRLKAKLAATGTNLDRSLFITAATARDMASRSATSAVKPLVIPADSVSAILVKVSPGSEAQGVATLIANRVPGVSASTGPRMFGTFRNQMTAVLKGLMAIVGIALGLSLVFIALVSTMAAHERRREIGVLRSLGATRPAIVASQVIQAVAVTLAGGLVGVGGAALGIWLFRDLIVKSLGFPFLYPPLGELALLAAEGLFVIVTGVALAVALPATAAALQEPATAMRD